MIYLNFHRSMNPFSLHIHIHHYPNFYLEVLRPSLPKRNLHRFVPLLLERGSSAHMLHIPYMQMAG